MGFAEGPFVGASVGEVVKPAVGPLVGIEDLMEGNIDGPLVGVTDERTEGRFVGIPLGGVV